MAQKPKIGENCTPTNASLGYITPQGIAGHNAPSDDTKRLFKPFKVEQSLVACNKKRFQFWISFFLLIFTWWQDVYAYSVYILMTSSSSGKRPNEPIIWLKV